MKQTTRDPSAAARVDVTSSDKHAPQESLSRSGGDSHKRSNRRLRLFGNRRPDNDSNIGCAENNREQLIESPSCDSTTNRIEESSLQMAPMPELHAKEHYNASEYLCDSFFSDSHDEIYKVQYVQLLTEGKRRQRKSIPSNGNPLVSARYASSMLNWLNARSHPKMHELRTVSTQASPGAVHEHESRPTPNKSSRLIPRVVTTGSAEKRPSALTLPDDLKIEYDDEMAGRATSLDEDDFIPPEFICFSQDDRSRDQSGIETNLVLNQLQANFEAMKVMYKKLENEQRRILLRHQMCGNNITSHPTRNNI